MAPQQRQTPPLLQRWVRDAAPAGARTTSRASVRHACTGCKVRGHTAAVYLTVQEDTTIAVDVNVNDLEVEIDTTACEVIKMEPTG